MLIKPIREQYGWVICIASTLLLFCTGGLGMTGFGAYQPYIIEHGGLTNTESSTMLMIRTAAMLIGLASANTFIKKLEIRRTITIAMLITTAAFAVYGFASNFIMYCIGAVLAGFGFGCGGMIPASVLIIRWFEEHRGLALGLCMAATGLSSLAASPFITYMVAHHSLRISFLMEGFFILCSAVLVWIIVRSMPECLNTHPIGEHQLHNVRMYAPKDASAPLYIAMVIGVFMVGIVANNYHPHISVLYNTCGYDNESVAALISIFGITLAFGKCAYGFLVDLIGAFRASLILYTLTVVGLGLTCLAGTGNLWIAYLAVSASGVGFAIVTVSISIYASGMSTEEHYAKTVSRLQLSSHIGSLVFGAVPGIIADTTGSYVPAFVIMLGLMFVAAILLSSVYRVITKRSGMPT